MTEAFLHYLWKNRLYDSEKLTTTDGIPLEVITPGQHNTDGGPDFFNSQIRIGDTLWAGNVEIHIRATDWERHSHQVDPAYDNCILHVVNESDTITLRTGGGIIPLLELKNRYPLFMWENYSKLVDTNRSIPCRHRISEVDDLIKLDWFDHLAAERLESKTKIILDMLAANNNDWQETFYQVLARNFGFRINAEPFEMLARSIPFKYLLSVKDRLSSLEAMLLGQAGFLTPEIRDEYPLKLKHEYSHFRAKYLFKSMDLSLWKFLRLRPVNFPVIRIAQFAQLIHQSQYLFARVIESPALKDIEALFRVAASGYWDNHFIIDRPAEKSLKNIGHGSIENILINTVIPFLFSWGLRQGSELHKKRALEFLELLPSEDNTFIRNWAECGVESRSALHSQALLHLGKNYCAEKKCLSCRIGNKLINTLP